MHCTTRAQQRLSSVVAPLCFCERIWSASWVRTVADCGNWQYSQRSPARTRTCARSGSFMALVSSRGQRQARLRLEHVDELPDAEVFFQIGALTGCDRAGVVTRQEFADARHRFRPELQTEYLTRRG